MIPDIIFTVIVTLICLGIWAGVFLLRQILSELRRRDR